MGFAYVDVLPPEIRNYIRPGTVELYHLVDGQYREVEPDEHGHYPISPLGVKLGIWSGIYQNMQLPWLRWWDDQGNMLLCAEEREERERQEKEHALQRVLRLEERLRFLGEEPDEMGRG